MKVRLEAEGVERPSGLIFWLRSSKAPLGEVMIMPYLVVTGSGSKVASFASDVQFVGVLGFGPVAGRGAVPRSPSCGRGRPGASCSNGSRSRRSRS